MAEQRPPRLRVAQLMNSDLRPYRLRFLELVGQSVDLSVFADRPKPNQGAPVEAPDTSAASFRVRRVRNLAWPGGGHRQAWQVGVLGLLRGRFDVIVIPEVVFNLSVWLVRFLAKPLGSRLAVFGFGYRPEPIKGGALAWARRLARKVLLGGADVAIVYTERGRSTLISEGFDEDRVFVTKNALDVAHLRRIGDAVEPDAVARLRVDMGRDDVLVFLGRLLDVKRLDLVIDAMRAMPETPALLVIGDGPARSALEDRAFGLPVRFLGAIYDETRVAEVLAAADLAVIPAKVGLAVVQCLAHGVPVVTTSQNAVLQTPEYDYLEGGANGVIIPEASQTAYAETLANLLADEDQIARLREGALQTAGGLSVEHMAEQFVAAMNYAVSNSSKSER